MIFKKKIDEDTQFEINQLVLSIADLDKQNKKIKNIIDSKDREIDELKERLSVYESDTDTVVMTKEKWEETKQEIERLKSLWETDRQSWNEQMAELTEENERLNKGYCKFKKECDNLPIKCMKEEIVRLNNIINELIEQKTDYGYVNILEMRLEQANNIINELEKELEKDFHTFMCNSREVGKTYKAGGNAYREHILLRLQELKGVNKE